MGEDPIPHTAKAIDKEDNMYYYEIQDVNGAIVKQSATPFDTGVGAADAAKDDLATMYLPSYPVEVRIYDGPPDDPHRYCSSTYYLSEEDIRQHARDVIERHNRQELQNILGEAISLYDEYKGMWERGLVTPRDFARQMALKWGEAEYRIREIE